MQLQIGNFQLSLPITEPHLPDSQHSRGTVAAAAAAGERALSITEAV